MSIRVCIFVDGENLRHTICELFSHFNPNDYLPKSADWTGFFDHLTRNAAGEDARRLRTYWYAIETVDFFPYSLPKVRQSGDESEQKLAKILSKHPPYREQLEGLGGEDRTAKLRALRETVIDGENSFQRKFRGWQAIQDGISQRHESVEFRRAGAIQYNIFEEKLGKEKAVDVKLAVDLLLLQNAYDVAVIVSGDQDYVPAVRAIKDLGKKVFNVAFRQVSGKLLPGGARRLNQNTDANMDIGYDEFEQFLNLSKESTAASG